MISTVHEGNEVQERSTDVRAYISPSRLNTWLRCPLAFKLRYVDGIRSPPSKSMFVGKMVHAGLECFYRYKQLGVTLPAGDVVQRMEACWESELNKFRQVYAAEAAAHKERQQGFRVSETKLKDGTIRLVCQR